MAQDYVGSNNINLLVPNGQFGTRFRNLSDNNIQFFIILLLYNIHEN